MIHPPISPPCCVAARPACVKWLDTLYRVKQKGDLAMEKNTERNPERDPAQAATTQIGGAHEILKALQRKIGQHPEIGEAITKLEMALNILAVKTGGQL
jgi:hypothetical protein